MEDQEVERTRDFHRIVVGRCCRAAAARHHFAGHQSILGFRRHIGCNPGCQELAAVESIQAALAVAGSRRQEAGSGYTQVRLALVGRRPIQFRRTVACLACDGDAQKYS